MQLRHILAAADDSEEGRSATLAAAQLSRRAGARLTILTVGQAARDNNLSLRLLESLRAETARRLTDLDPRSRLDVAVAIGLPGIEIARYAETCAVDLIVMGRKPRTSIQRLLIGDTGDAVARRSRTPCLFVKAGRPDFTRVLAALDGTERGLAVLVAAMDFTRDCHSRLRTMTVEPAYANERDAPWLATGRSDRLAQAIDHLRNNSSLGAEAWDPVPGTHGRTLVVHRGRVVDEILAEVEASSADVLVLGYHRGGPAGMIEAGSIARRLMHESRSAVLTVPL
jgi:nucleotide-binding universal stress UspA family protein